MDIRNSVCDFAVNFISRQHSNSVPLQSRTFPFGFVQKSLKLDKLCRRNREELKFVLPVSIHFGIILWREFDLKPFYSISSF